jgi:hypothetical protein
MKTCYSFLGFILLATLARLFAQATAPFPVLFFLRSRFGLCFVQLAAAKLII